jgi:hypothetical protein
VAFNGPSINCSASFSRPCTSSLGRDPRTRACSGKR